MGIIERLTTLEGRIHSVERKRIKQVKGRSMVLGERKDSRTCPGIPFVTCSNLLRSCGTLAETRYSKHKVLRSNPTKNFLFHLLIFDTIMLKINTESG